MSSNCPLFQLARFMAHLFVLGLDEVVCGLDLIVQATTAMISALTPAAPHISPKIPGSVGL